MRRRGHMFGILGLGFLLGMQHALEADHIAAVSSIAARRSHVGSMAAIIRVRQLRQLSPCNTWPSSSGGSNDFTLPACPGPNDSGISGSATGILKNDSGFWRPVSASKNSV